MFYEDVFKNFFMATEVKNQKAIQKQISYIDLKWTKFMHSLFLTIRLQEAFFGYASIPINLNFSMWYYILGDNSHW